MEIVVVSSPGKVENEFNEVIAMFDAGLGHFHIRKPRFTRKQMKVYIEQFPQKYRKRLILHSYHSLAFRYKLGGIHLSRQHRKRGALYRWQLMWRRALNPSLVVTRTYHKLSDFQTDKHKYSYVFLGPVFDSISHSVLGAGFSKRSLLLMLPKAPFAVYAMGGIKEENLEQVIEYNFQGIAVLGAIWDKGNSPREQFRYLQDKAASLRTENL